MEFSHKFKKIKYESRHNYLKIWMKLIFLLFKCKKVFLLIKNIFFVLYLLYDDECISYSTLDLIFFILFCYDCYLHGKHHTWPIGKEECAGCDIIQFLSHIPCAIDHNPCFLNPNFAFSKAKELYFLFQLGGTLRGNHQHPFGL